MKRKVLVLALVSVVVEAAVVAARRGGLLRIDTVVRCRRGHLFTTYWIPGASFKALRLGWWRFQRCPVGHHWSLVTPIRSSELPPADLDVAHSVHDLRIP